MKTCVCIFVVCAIAVVALVALQPGMKNLHMEFFNFKIAIN